MSCSLKNHKRTRLMYQDAFQESEMVSLPALATLARGPHRERDALPCCEFKQRRKHDVMDEDWSVSPVTKRLRDTPRRASQRADPQSPRRPRLERLLSQLRAAVCL
jgi:hypothetical protein